MGGVETGRDLSSEELAVETLGKQNYGREGGKSFSERAFHGCRLLGGMINGALKSEFDILGVE